MRVQIHTTIKSEKVGHKLWMLTEQFCFSVNNANFFIPKGFIWDGNSTPRALWSICAPMSGYYAEAGLVHDYLYSLDSPHLIAREWADMIHKELALYRGAGTLRANTVYYTLRAAGKSSFKQMHSIDKVKPSTVYEYAYTIHRIRNIS